MKSYWELDYRGKFIRTLWTMPVTILAISFLLSLSIPLTIAASVFLLFLHLAQLIYNYTKWKVKFKPDWQDKMDLMANKVNIVPEKKAVVLGITFIVIIHILFYLFPIKN